MFMCRYNQTILHLKVEIPITLGFELCHLVLRMGLKFLSPLDSAQIPNIFVCLRLRYANLGFNLVYIYIYIYKCIIGVKFGDGAGPNLYRGNKVNVSSTFYLKYFQVWVFQIVYVMKIQNKIFCWFDGSSVHG